MKNMDENENTFESDDLYNELDLNSIFESIIRKKNLFLSVLSSILFLSFCYAFTRKPVWQGQFQIVLTQNQNSSINNQLLNNLNNTGLMGLGNKFSINTNLNTELEILKSPSVLKPIFDFVKDQKEIKGKNIENFNFEDWSETISVKLKAKTTVLDLSYRDTDKELILPVINKISNAYKDYPDRDKNKSISKSIKYFEDQIEYYLDLSEKAFRDFIAFSLENNLSTGSFRSRSETIDQPINDRDPRILLQNQISGLEFSLNEIEKFNLDDFDDKLLFLDIYFSDNSNISEISDEIRKKVRVLREMREYFTEEDKDIKELKSQIRNLNKIMYDNIKIYIKSELSALKSRLKIISKPKDVIIKTKEMKREVIRLENIVNKLENNKQILLLQLAEKNNPWELISTPTLNDNPISPRKKQIVLLGFLSGLTLGVIAVLCTESFSGLIYNIKELKSLIKCKFLKDININNEADVEDSLSLIGKKINQKSNIKELGLVFLTDLTKENIENFKKILINSVDNINIIDSDNPNLLSNCDSIILIIQKGIVSRSQIAEYEQKFKLLNLNMLGWVFLRT